MQSRFWVKDKEIQERWFRFKLYIKYGKKLKQLMLWRLHRRLQKQFRITDRAINDTIDVTVKQLRTIDDSLFPASKQFFNISLYFLLAERDVQALKADAFAHPNSTKRNIALRTLLLTIYEWDMGKVTGKNLYNIYQVTGISDQTKSDLVSALKEVRKARKAIENQFSETRHNTIAHRDPDAIRQYDIMSQLDIMSFKPALVDFYVASDKLLKAMVTALLEIGSMPNLFHQVVHSNKCT